MPLAPLNISNSFREMRSDYAASQPSRFRRDRRGLSGGADAHYADERKFLEMREFVRDMDRNDFMIGQLVDRAVANQVQTGYLVKPDTGDPALDQDLFDEHQDWGRDPDRCDYSGELTFVEMERLIPRAEYVDGDIFVLPIEDGTLQLVEADRCRTPEATTRNVVHGILLNDRRQALEYWFSKNQLNPRDRVYRVADMDRYPARDPQTGERQVLHIKKPTRVSQTRGVNAFKAIQDVSGMVDDVNFAALVKQQAAACFVGFWQRMSDYSSDSQAGDRQQILQPDGTSSILEQLSPGQMLRGAKGEDFKILSSQIPSAEFFQHMRFLLQVIGFNIGMPLALALLDANEGNFSNHRVVLDQARMGFRCEQYRRKGSFYYPHWRIHVRRRIAKEPAIRAASKRSNIKIFRHEWDPPSWPYLQPLHDAQADAVRLENLLTSPEDLCAEEGRDWKRTIASIIRNNGEAVAAAILEAKRISDLTKETIHWRDIYNRALPRGAEIIQQEIDSDTGEPVDAGSTPPAKKPAAK